MKSVLIRFFSRYWFVLSILLALGLRLSRLTGPLDEPHSWRQADTANYSLDLYRFGFNPLRPMVCWMGIDAVLILEFPFYEALVAAFYFVFGEELIIARFISLGFWGGSVVYFYYLLQLFYERDLSRLAALTYSVLPLGLFYSRAVHIDFTAIFFTHAFAYHMIRWLQQESRRDAVFCVLFGILAAMIKVPYLFCICLPLLMCSIRDRKRVMAVMLLLVPAIVFAVWRLYVRSVNAAAPDLDFLPGYFKFIDMGWWYFGTLAERFVSESWRILALRLTYEIATPAGLVPVVIGIMLECIQRRRRFILIWFAGCVFYLLIFFPLNVAHNYYQIPFLPLVAFFMAVSIHSLKRVRFLANEFLRSGLQIVFLGLLIYQSCEIANRIYYRVDVLRYAAGRFINENTKESDLIIVSSDHTDPRDPRILYAARRHGYSVPAGYLNREIVGELANRGASYLALVRPAGAENLPSELSDIRFTKCVLLNRGIQVGTLLWARIASPKPIL